MAQTRKKQKTSVEKNNFEKPKSASSKKKKSKKKKNIVDNFRKQNIIALFLLLIGMIFLLSITTSALGVAGAALKAILLGQFAAIAIFVSLVMIIIGVARLVYSSKFDLSIISPGMIVLVFMGAMLFYGALNIYFVKEEKISFDILRNVFIQSAARKNIGMWPYIVSFFMSKWIGKVGMYLFSLGIFLFVTIYYFKVSFSKIGDASIALANGSREAVKGLKKKTIDYITIDEDKEPEPREKLDDTVLEDKFAFLERYKKEVAQFTEFSDPNKESISKSFAEALSQDEDMFLEDDLKVQIDESTDLVYETELQTRDNNKDKHRAPSDECNHEIEEIDRTIKREYDITKRYEGLGREINSSKKDSIFEEGVIDNRGVYHKDRAEKENLERFVMKDQPISALKKNTSYTLPQTELLKSYSLRPKEKSQQLKEIHKLESTLKIYGIEAKVVNISVGPTITRYELQLKIGVKVSKILNLSDDLALAMAAVAPIRIEAPIPGTSLIGIELPNAETDIVSFREMLETKEFIKSNGKVPVALGQDVSGKPVIADITKMPHVLVAGATGSGKSVCINTLICSILYKSKPEEVKMIMIDPKMVELSVYNDIPHLLVPVVTDMKKAPYALSWAVTEMNKRYKLFAENRVRDLEGYNLISGVEKLPRIIIIVDELADLMMVSPHEVEDSIIRLAQKARACGMHLVIATQRPSVDVITGLIKANIPTRIAFAVSSQIDSRTILDQVGAEKLIGKGDMLFSHPSIAKPQRIQGPFISDDEVNQVVDFILSQGHRSDEQEDIIEESIKKEENDQKEEEHQDPLLDEIKAFVMGNKQISTSLVQRRFRIGYNRASRIIDQLEEMGIVSESDGAKPRRVLISLENDEGAEI